MEPYHPSVFARYQRSERALLAACAEMYFMGVSTRKVASVLEKMGGFELSAGTVSRVAAELDEQLKTFRERRLDDRTWPYLLVDATYLKVQLALQLAPLPDKNVIGLSRFCWGALPTMNTSPQRPSKA